MKKWLCDISGYLIPIFGWVSTAIIFGLKVKNLINLEIVENKELVTLLSELGLLLLWTFSLIMTFLGKNFSKINKKLDYMAKLNMSYSDYKEFEEIIGD